ncbi:MAG: hypoxanthine phosphoribosyltransferase [Flavobacteriales bacterium]|nr:hypoxanthine phosphoribosyltransferase [Flavobacteriales bacterium]|tara:strand:+ start:828 stop:1361 length:534 start_codon:yes stop_codon:yes gene_type:complete
MIQLHDKIFEPYISKEEIQKSIAKTASKMNVLKNKNPIFLVVLNGSFLFASDLLKQLKFDAEVCFIKLKSYEGTKSTGTVTEIMGLLTNISNRTVVVLEDIVDTGNTLEKIYSILKSQNPKEILIATLLFKPSSFQKKLDIHYICKEIPDEFVVGYGLDYKELGRTLPQIYKLKNNT